MCRPAKKARMLVTAARRYERWASGDVRSVRLARSRSTRRVTARSASTTAVATEKDEEAPMTPEGSRRSDRSAAVVSLLLASELEVAAKFGDLRAHK